MIDLTPQALIQDAIVVIVVMMSASLHEVAHGWVAYKCGDNTAKAMGRLTLNPLAHIDLFGSIILPFLMMLLGGPVFGYAKPVPYNPNNLRNRRTDELLVALAGPASNMFQVILGFIVLFLLGHLLPANEVALTTVSTHGSSGIAVLYWVFEILSLYIWANLILCFFNLLPIPPLDGSHIIAFFLKGKALLTYYQIARYSLPILLIILYVFPMMFHVNPLGAYFNVTAGVIYKGILNICFV